MNIEDERRKFEAWYAGEYLNASSPIFRDAQFAKTGNDTYHSAEVRKSWNGWLARAEAEGWMPIESAPRDGTPILVCYADTYVSNGFLPIAVRWRSYHPNAKGEEDFRDIGGARIRKITHWMPLPTPPKENDHG